MRRVVWHLSVMAISLGMAVPALAPAQASTAASPKAWRVLYWASSASVHIASITAPAKPDAWAVGTYRNAHHAERPLVLHWDGARWARYAVPGMRPGCELTDVAASSPGDVWIFCSRWTGGDVVYRWNGQSWRTMTGPPSDDVVSEAVVLSGTDVWVPGIQGCSGPDCANIYQWNGSTWVPRPVGVQIVWFLSGAGRQVAAIGCTSSTTTCRPSAFQWTGARWQAVAGPYDSRRTADPTIAVSPTGELWIQSIPLRRGSVIIYERQSAKWHAVVAPTHLSGLPMEYQSSLRYDGHNGVWSGASAHWTGRRWVNALLVAASEPASMTALVAPIPGTASTWGLGGGAPCPSERRPRNFIAVFGTSPH